MRKIASRVNPFPYSAVNCRDNRFFPSFGDTSILPKLHQNLGRTPTFAQRDLIYRPNSKLSMRPDASAFNLPYQDVWISIAGSQARLHGWWVSAPSQQEKFVPLPAEPTSILSAPKVILYLCGVGRNMGDYNYLARVSAFRQLGFSVLVFDYRGYGLSEGAFPDFSYSAASD